jgi:hypothetical protein
LGGAISQSLNQTNDAPRIAVIETCNRLFLLGNADCMENKIGLIGVLGK